MVSGKPNTDAAEDGGTQTVELDMNMGDTDVDGRCRIVRLDSAGNIEESGAFTATQQMAAGNLTFSPVSPTWGSAGDPEACTDRFAIEFEFVENAGMNAILKFDIRVATAEVITDITEDGGTCGAVAEVVPRPNLINSSAMI